MGLVETKRVQRLLRAVAENRKNCSFDDLRPCCSRLDLSPAMRRVRTSSSSGALAISVPRRKPVKEVYVDEVLALIGQITD
jgi:hypothetical protein